MDKQHLAGLAGVLLVTLLNAATAAADPPALILDGGMQATASQPVTLPLAFSNGGHTISAIAFSIDLDAAHLAFDPTDGDLDGLPDSVNLPAGMPAVTVIDYDPTDGDGEIDVVLANLSGEPLPQGVILEFEMTPSQDGVVADWLAFSNDPPASFSNDQGEDVAGTTEVLGAGVLFADGFESGDLSAW